MYELDGLRLGLISAVTAAVVWLIYRRQIRALNVPRRPAIHFGAVVAAGFLGVLALYSHAGTAGDVLAGAGILGALAFILVSLTSRLPTPAIKVAVEQEAPEFTASDDQGLDFTLSSLRGQAVLLKFFSGRGSPHCVAELRRWDAFRAQFDLFGVKMVAISGDTVAETARMKRRHRLGMTLLSDRSLDVIDLYGLRYQRAMSGPRGLRRAVAIPATFLIDADGVVRWIELVHDSRLRSDVDRVMTAVKKALTRPLRTGEEYE